MSKAKRVVNPDASSEDSDADSPSNNSKLNEIQDDTKLKKKSGLFQTMGLLSILQKAILKKGFRLPTPIQRKCIPPLLEGKDVVGMARTGSGKTAAFVLPMLQALKAHSIKVGIRGLVLAPSRELALQTFSVIKELGKFTDLRNILLVGGDNLEEQFARLATNPDIVVATPGRLMHLCVETSLSLKEVQFVVWDEADRLMEDPTLAEQMKEINLRLPETRQTTLFSATLPKALAEFAQAGLKNPLLVRLDSETKLSPDLQMAFIQIKSESKDALLMLLLNKILLKQKNNRQQSRSNDKSNQLTVIFAATKHHVEYLQELLTSFNIPCCYIYGALDQTARKIAIDQFRKGIKPILVVTDVAARGIDIPLLDNVINYDFPSTPKLFVHRVGRVARAGRSGRAYSFVSPDEISYLFDLQLFLGYTLKSASEANEASSDLLLLGIAPQHLLDEEQEGLSQRLSISGSLSSLQNVMKNSIKLYRRTRVAASPESHRRSKAFIEQCPNLGIHPLFKSLGVDIGHYQVLQSLQQFKPRTNHLNLSKPTFKKNSSIQMFDEHAKSALPSSSKDEANYLKYTKEGTQDDAGYSISGSFAEQARRAMFDLSSTTTANADDPNLRKKRSKRGQEMIKTEYGTKVPSSFRTDVYDKWRAKTHLDIQRPGEIEMESSSTRAKTIITSNDERRKWRNKRLDNKNKSKSKK